MTDADPHVDDNGVFLNNLGLTSADDLRRAEADLSFAALLRLSVRPVPGSYDLEHLREFHREIFGAVYPWAGELRRVDIARSQSEMFCRWQFIESYSAGVFAELGAENYLRKPSGGGFVGRLAHYYAEINAIHPFRDGNGRTQRAFLGQLARDAGWRIAWSELDRERNDAASAAGLHGDERPLLDLLGCLVRPL
jgi:cell filamentation protein